MPKKKSRKKPPLRVMVVRVLRTSWTTSFSLETIDLESIRC
jgi:hypothetical protein